MSPDSVMKSDDVSSRPGFNSLKLNEEDITLISLSEKIKLPEV